MRFSNQTKFVPNTQPLIPQKIGSGDISSFLPKKPEPFINKNPLEILDKYTGRPTRAAALAALQGENPFQAAKDAVTGERDTTGMDVSRKLMEMNPQLGFPTPEGTKEYPLEKPIGLAADVALDPTNLPLGGLGKFAALAGIAPKLRTAEKVAKDAHLADEVFNNPLAKLRKALEGKTPIERPINEGFNLGAKGFEEQAYPDSIKVLLKNKDPFHQELNPLGLSGADEVKGLNPGHAEYRARQNWPWDSLALDRLNTDVPSEEVDSLIQQANEIAKKYQK
jgi:hypothetical protein